MSTYWKLETHGDPLGAVHHLIQHIWQSAHLEGMLVAVNGADSAHDSHRVLRDPGEVNGVNPFKPWMAANSARFIPGLLAEYPNAQMGVVLRPCEMRALAGMANQAKLEADNLLTISVDCLATYPIEEVQWRAKRKGSQEQLEEESLRFARQGGMSAYRYRPACQMCPSPAASDADINIGVLGLPARQYILVWPRNPGVASKAGLGDIVHGRAESELVSQRDRILARLTEQHDRTRERVIDGLSNVMPRTIDDLLVQLDDCESCRECMDACPICSVAAPQRQASGHYLRLDLENWLVSCAGCGMCEQACHRHLPLSTIFTFIKQQLKESYKQDHRQSRLTNLPLS
jgi:formate dehydrogenase (coenzyme F420) beta subunit